MSSVAFMAQIALHYRQAVRPQLAKTIQDSHHHHVNGTSSKSNCSKTTPLQVKGLGSQQKSLHNEEERNGIQYARMDVLSVKYRKKPTCARGLRSKMRGMSGSCSVSSQALSVSLCKLFQRSFSMCTYTEAPHGPRLSSSYILKPAYTFCSAYHLVCALQVLLGYLPYHF